MEKKTLLLATIPIVGVLVVATLLYLWLAPNVASKMIVYMFCFGTLIVQGTVSGVLWHFIGSSHAMPVVVSGSAFTLSTLVAGCMILVLDVPFRMALYFLAIFSMLYFVCVGYLTCVAADDLWNRAANTIVELPSIRRSLRDWLQALKGTFSRRQPGETDAERHVRNSNMSHPGPFTPHPPVSHGPPPLPGRDE